MIEISLLEEAFNGSGLPKQKLAPFTRMHFLAPKTEDEWVVLMMSLNHQP